MKGWGRAHESSARSELFISERGGSGGVPPGFPQHDLGVESAISSSPIEAAQPSSAAVQDVADLSELIAAIGVWIRRLGWTREQANQFIADRFNGKRRAQLTDDELLELLYCLQTLLLRD